MNYEKVHDVFISYRRNGGESMAILLRDRLTSKNYSVFLDIESLNSGSFNTKLLQVIENCTDFVIVLSEGSLDRCVNEDDWVRMEILHALRNNKNVIPIMLRGFEWPQNMPRDIAVLSMKNGVNANSNEYFDAAIDRLAEKFLISKPKNLFDKLGSFAKNAADATATKMQLSEKMEISKINSKIDECNMRIASLKMQISDFYWAKFQRGEPLDPGALELCIQINDALYYIEDCNREIQKIKASLAPPKPNEPGAQAAVFCSACGAAIDGKTRFCPDCGAPIVLQKPDTPPGSLYCPGCGEMVPAGKKFCPESGGSLGYQPSSYRLNTAKH